MKTIIIIASCFLITSCAGGNWTGEEKNWMFTFTLTTIGDGLTTSQFEKNGICEKNKLVRKKDSCYPDMKKVWIGVGIANVAVFTVAHYMPHNWRLNGLKIVTTGEGAVVMWNLAHF